MSVGLQAAAIAPRLAVNREVGWFASCGNSASARGQCGDHKREQLRDFAVRRFANAEGVR